jgi:hypothetical protein
MSHVAMCCLRLHNLCVDDKDIDFGIAELDVAGASGGRPVANLNIKYGV